MKKPRLRVSDHALVRYLERVGGFDIERLRLDIARRLQEAADAGACRVTVDGHIFTISRDAGGPVVSTVLIDAEGYGQSRRYDRPAE